ncbi:Arginyl-tRNA--protein transferase 1, partial [Coemansia spiralis]
MPQMAGHCTPPGDADDACAPGQSLVEILGMQRRAECGYCHTPHGSRCFAMLARRLTCADYQELIDRGWRRSGRQLYLTDHSDSCCAYYTIRTHALRHELRASERKLLRRWRQARLLAPVPAGPGALLEDQVQAAGERLQ